LNANLLFFQEEGNIELVKAIDDMSLFFSEKAVELIDSGLPQEDIEVELLLLSNLNNFLNPSLFIVGDFESLYWLIIVLSLKISFDFSIIFLSCFYLSQELSNALDI
jgi:hypothetical protein